MFGGRAASSSWGVSRCSLPAPTSCSLRAGRGGETTVLVRIRAYLEGRLRDDRGEVHPPPVEPEPVPATIDELCAEPRELVLGERRLLRQAPRGGAAPLERRGL